MRFILIKLPNWLGDVVMLTPTIALLQRTFPHAKFVLVGNALSTSVFVCNHFISKIFVDTSKEQKGFFKRINVTKKLANEINRYLKEQGIAQFDCAITTQNNFFSAFLLAKIEAKQRVGYGDRGMFGVRKFLLTHPIKFKSGRPPLCNHQVLSYVNLLLAILPPQFFEERLQTQGSKEEQEIALTHLKQNPHYNPQANLVQNVLFSEAKDLTLFAPLTKRFQDHKIAGISPGASYGESKMWLAQYFTETIISLVKSGYKVRIYGANNEKERNLSIYENSLKMLPQHLHNNIEDLSGKTSIMQLIDSLKNCSVYLGNDSGTTHIARALNIPSVILFGSMPFAWCSPWSSKDFIKKQGEYYCIGNNTIAVQKQLPCVPCKKKVCPLTHHNCMKLITPDEVLNLLESLRK